MASATPDSPPAPAAAPRIGGPRLSSLAWKTLFAGLLLREAFSFWTGHPYDFEIWIRTGFAVAHGQNPYAFWPPVPGVSIAYYHQTLPSASYLPFWPLLLGGLYRAWESVGFGNRFVLYFLLKQPSILGDVLVAYLLYRVVDAWGGGAVRARAALTFWSFFPYAIIVSAIWGQFDSLVVALILAAFLVKGPFERSVLYGVGIWVKWITAIYLPLEFFAARGWRRSYVLVAVLLPAAATALVFYAFGWGFTNLAAASASETRGGGGGMNWVGVITSGPVHPLLAAVSGVYFVLSYLWVPAVVVGGWVAARWFATERPRECLRAIILVTALLLLFRWGLYEQYMVYLFALVLLDVIVFEPERRALFRTIVVLATVYLLFNNEFGIRFLAPLSPSVTQFTDALDGNAVFSVLRTVALIVLALLVTVTLVQIVVGYYRDELRPRPWVVGARLSRPLPPERS